jgi:hypothetical protein
VSERWTIGYIAEAFPVIRPYPSLEMLDILEYSESDEWIAEHLEHYDDGEPRLEAVIVHGRTGALLSVDTAFPEGKRNQTMRMSADAWVLPWSKEAPHCAAFAHVFQLPWPMKKFPLSGPAFIRAARDAGLIARLRSGPLEIPPVPPAEERRDWREEVSKVEGYSGNLSVFS